MSKSYFKIPRLYTAQALKIGETVSLGQDAAHYLGSVMRRKEGDPIRLFNGRDGECLAEITRLSKKDVNCEAQETLRLQSEKRGETHLIFCPIRKDRMDFLIEKAVELGVTHLHPILTQNTDIRQMKHERIQKQVVEAAEQCERLTIPEVLELKTMYECLEGWEENCPVFAAVERGEHPELSDVMKTPEEYRAFLIGPTGGWSAEEAEWLAQQSFIRPVSLGPRILRVETAACVCLTLNLFSGSK